MDKRLRIILELIGDKFASGTKGALGTFRDFIGGIGHGVKSAASSLANLAQHAFFVKEAFMILANAARSLWDLFVSGAQSLKQLEARFIAMTGSAQSASEVMSYAKEQALKYGRSTEDVANALFLMAGNAKDASGAFDMGRLQELNGLLMELVTLRPDLPVERLARGLNSFLSSGDINSLEMILDLPLRSTKALQDIATDLGQQAQTVSRGATSIEVGAAGAAGSALDRLQAIKDAIGELAPGLDEAMSQLSETQGMERLARVGEDLAASFGGPVFESLNALANQLADLYEEDPQAFRDAMQQMGEAVGGLIEALAELVTSDLDAEELAEKLGALADAISEADLVGMLSDVAMALQNAAQAIQSVLDALETIQELRAQAGGVTPMGGGLEGANGGQRPMSSLMGGSVMGGGLEQRVKLEVHVTSDTDLFNAHVKQVADGSVADGLNELNGELENAQ